ncbi:MAG: hypothetical protein HXY40_02450 [Chloroflexi bacterium]|nr:hypothetical protein [Chloroflexota bacterium]
MKRFAIELSVINLLVMLIIVLRVYSLSNFFDLLVGILFGLAIVLNAMYIYSATRRESAKDDAQH